MDTDPRSPPKERLVHCGSTHPAHAELRKTLSLLQVAATTPPVYLVVEGLGSVNDSLAELNESREYFYEEHSCPTNFVRVELICCDGDTDPHGVFEHVETIWMTDEYEAAKEEGQGDEYLMQAFPQLTKKAAV